VDRRAGLIVLDGVGIGPAPDTDQYGDAGSDTLGNVARAAGGLRIPNLERLGLGRCAPLAGVVPVETPEAAWGLALPASAGKDSTSGHWELCGLTLKRAFRTYPDGFPASFVEAFSEATGRGVLGNKPASGTAILEELGPEHLGSGKWILYTSADSVCQIAAHEELISLTELYRACEVARRLLIGDEAVLRVIARPFVGGPGSWKRTERRRDFSIPPPGETLLDRLAAAHVPRIGVGKVDDLFAGRGITSIHPANNAEAYQLIASALRTMPRGFLFANVVEFDHDRSFEGTGAGHRHRTPGTRPPHRRPAEFCGRRTDAGGVLRPRAAPRRPLLPGGDLGWLIGCLPPRRRRGRRPTVPIPGSRSGRRWRRKTAGCSPAATWRTSPSA
jgi:phosphopentomutase